MRIGAGPKENPGQAPIAWCRRLGLQFPLGRSPETPACHWRNWSRLGGQRRRGNWGVSPVSVHKRLHTLFCKDREVGKQGVPGHFTPCLADPQASFHARPSPRKPVSCGRWLSPPQLTKRPSLPRPSSGSPLELFCLSVPTFAADQKRLLSVGFSFVARVLYVLEKAPRKNY